MEHILTEKEINDKIISLISDKVELEEGETINLNDSFSNDLGLDSLDIVEIFQETEKFLKDKGVLMRNLSDQEMEKIDTAQELEDVIKKIHL